MATLTDLSEWLAELPAKLQPDVDDMFYAGDQQRERIRNRTEQGVGVDGQVFAPYAPRTKKGPPVNLRETGNMLDSIVVDSDDSMAHLFMGNDDAEKKAIWNQFGTEHSPGRPFMGVSLQERDELLGDIRERIFSRLK